MRLPLLCLMIALLASPALRAETTVETQRDGDVVIEGTLQAVPGYPRVHVQLRRNGQVVTGEPAQLGGLGGLQGLGDLLQRQGGRDAQPARARSFTAFLDTGASAYVISKSTADRFGLARIPNALYHETGLHGQIPMHVSRPYTVALSGTSGRIADEPADFRVVDRNARLQLQPKPPGNPLVAMAMGELNIVGMPAIRELVVEFDAAPMQGGGGLAGQLKGLRGLQGGQGGGNGQMLQNLDQILDKLDQVGVGPAVRLHPPDFQPRNVDLVIPLDGVNYTRQNNPKDRGPLPTLAKNPVVRNITTRHGNQSFTGDWLFDTGAPASLISTEQAEALGLYRNGNPVRPPDFSIQLGGAGGKMTNAPGFRIDRLRIPTARGRTIEYRDVHVLVHDVGVTLDNGERVVLDGIFGTNLLLPTVSLGGGLGLPTGSAAGPYEHIWIDGPRGRLLLDLAE